ncbi:unnamed protein product [Schistosoma rodhaini]|nr:unnamed protein product [Schistosoma rodhaini]
MLIDSQFTGALFPVLLFQINTKLIANDQDHLNVDTDHEKLKMNLFPNYSITTTSTTEFTQTQSNYCTMNEMKHLSKLKITYSRDNIQNNWPIHLFKIFQIDISPLNVQAEELLLLKLIQFYQHAFEEDTDTDERNNSYNHHLHSSHSSHNYDDNDPSVLSDSFKIPLAHNSDKRKHSMLHNTKSENKIFWCDRFIISPIHMKLSVQTAKSSLTESYLAGAKRLLPSLMSFTGAEIQLDPIEKLYMLESIPQLINYLNTYYRLQLRAHALNIFGSVDFLGNPIGLINDLSSGISGLVELDVGGLIRHVAHGVGDSAAKGFVYGVGRGLLGTVTKPVGGVFDFLSSSSSNNNNVNESDPTTKLSPINSYKLTDLDLTYSFSRMLCIYTLLPCNNGPEALASHHLRYLIYSPESILHILPIQLNGVVVLITDQAIWCIRDNSLQNWITSKYPVGNHNINMSDSNSSVASHQTPPVFFLTENTTLMFMLHYHRLDQIYVMLSSNTTTLSSVSTSTINSTTTITSTTNPPTTNPPVYVVFSADCGTSKQQLRCDYLTWGLDLTLLVRNAQFRFAQANMRVNRLMNISTNTTSSSSLSTGSSKNNKQQLTTACYNVPRFQNHPVALAYSPICHK